MARLTIKQLTAELEAALVRANKAEAELASLRSAQREAPRAAPTSNAYREACAKARELAMRSGKTVRISA